MNIEDVVAVASDPPLPGMPDKRRVWRGAVALAGYISVYSGASSEDVETLITDLIADLGHLADYAGVDFEHTVSWGLDHLEAERQEQE